MNSEGADENSDQASSAISDAAVTAIELGLLATLEEVQAQLAAGATEAQLADKHGALWQELEPQINLASNLQKAGSDFRQNLPAFDKAALFAGIQPQFDNPFATGMSADSNAGLRAVDTVAGSSQPKILPFRPRQGVGGLVRGLSWPARIAASFLVFLLLTSIFAAAAEASSPGDFLYGAKLTLERSSEIFAFSPEDKEQASINFCSSRLHEIEGLEASGRYDLIDGVNQEYLTSLNEITKLQATQKLSPALAVQLDNQRTRFVALQNKGNLPPSSQAQLKQAVSYLNQLSPGNATTLPTSSTAYTSTPAASPVETHATETIKNGVTETIQTATIQATPSPDSGTFQTSTLTTGGATASTTLNSPSLAITPTESLSTATSVPLTSTPLPQPTQTPAPVVVVPQPSSTPAPTDLPLPTSTPTPVDLPQPTNTPKPTILPLPSNTPLPLPTNTLLPILPTPVLPAPTKNPIPPVQTPPLALPTKNPSPPQTTIQITQPAPTTVNVPGVTTTAAETQPTKTPKSTKTPKPTEIPKPSETPDPTDPPKPTKTPKPTETPKSTKTPKTPDPTKCKNSADDEKQPCG